MKSSKKIILPILTIGSIVSIATPLITSCANNNVIAENSSVDYTPTITKHESITYETIAAASNEYFSKIIQNPNIFFQDYLNHAAQLEKDEKMELEKTYSNVVFSFKESFTSFNVSLDNQEKGIYKLSFKKQYTKHITYEEQLPDSIVKKVEYKQTDFIEFINVPVILNYFEQTEEPTFKGWLLNPATHESSFQDWQFKKIEDIENSSIANGQTSKITSHLEVSRPAGTLPSIWFVSYYFSDVKKG